MNQALDELFTKLGFDRRALWRISVIFWMVFVGSCVLAVYLSAWDMKEGIVAMLYLYLILGALPILFAPAFWLIAGGVFAIAGQFGREKGLSFKDAYAAVKEYGTPIVNTVGYILLLALPIWFIAMTLIDTKGLEKWFLFGLPLLPLTIYLVVKRWPDGKTFERVVRTVLLTVVLGILALGVAYTVYNKIEAAAVDPEVRQVQEYLAGLEVEEKKKIQGVVEVVINKKKTGKPITKLEQGILDELERRAKEQSLKPADLKAKAKKFVETAQPTEASWWKANWFWLLGATLALIIATRVWRAATRPTVVTATGGSVVTSAGHGTTHSAGKGKWWAALVVAVIAWSWYSIDQEQGFPGTWWVGKTYTISWTNLRSQQLCGVRTGMRRITVMNADQVMRVNGELVPIHAYFIKKNSGDRNPVRYNMAEYVLFNGTGPGEKTRVTEDGCLNVSAFDHLTEETKAKVVILGKTAGSEPEMAILMKVHVR